MKYATTDKLNDSMKAKVFKYKSDGNTVVAPYMELEPYAENVYLSLSRKNEYGNEDDDCFHVVCRIEFNPADHMETVIVFIPVFVLSRQGEIYILRVRLQFHIRSHDGIPIRLVLEYFCFHTIVQFVGCCIFHL